MPDRVGFHSMTSVLKVHARGWGLEVCFDFLSELRHAFRKLNLRMYVNNKDAYADQVGTHTVCSVPLNN